MTLRVSLLVSTFSILLFSGCSSSSDQTVDQNQALDASTSLDAATAQDSASADTSRQPDGSGSSDASTSQDSASADASAPTDGSSDSDAGTAQDSASADASGSANISAPVEGAVFSPGNTITIKGTTQNLSSATLTVTDTSGMVLKTQSVTGATFSISYAISYSPEPSYGQYTITVADPNLAGAYVRHFTVAVPSPLVVAGTAVVSPVALSYSDLRKMTQVQQKFSSIDDSQAFRVYATQGVKLADILAKAIYVGTPASYTFVGSDGFSFKLSKQEVDASRYYFTSATATTGTPVDAVVGLFYNGSGDSSNMTTNGCLRDFFGQQTVTENIMGSYVKNLVEIDANL